VADYVWSCKKRFGGLACKGLPLDYENEREQQYCVLHFPSADKDLAAFGDAIEEKLKNKDFNFAGVYFPGKQSLASSLPNTTFERAVDFSEATFEEGADFSRATFKERADFSEATFEGAAYFSEATFGGEADFADVIFKKKAVFSSGIFDRTTFEGPTYFIGVTFEGAAYFDRVICKGLTVFSKWLGQTRTAFKEGAFFSGAIFERPTTFSEAQFSGEWTDFDRAQFSGKETDFSEAEFGSGQTGFQEATFNGLVSFSEATFKEKVTFWGTQKNRVFDTQAWVWFHDSRIEKPELLTFNTVLLHPGWFLNTDVRKVDFTDVDWYGMPGGPEGTLAEEIHALKIHRLGPVSSPFTGVDREIESPHTLLTQTCRRLSANAEQNGEYQLANELYYWSMDALRIARWGVLYEALLKEEVRRNVKEGERRDILFKDLRSPKNLQGMALLRKDTWQRIRGRTRFGRVNSFYWALSGYGVRATRALWALVAIWLVFAALYFLLVESSPFWVFSASDFRQGVDYARQAAVYSLSALARLNPRPQSEELNWFQTLVTIEGILGPLQIALLALAVRRKVMR
jgi:uncharacterized protein YjbI with pentapeptide repeats